MAVTSASSPHPSDSPHETRDAPRGNDSSPGDRRRTILTVAFLVLAVAVVFGRIGGYPFINYDDELYVGRDLPITGGFTPAGISYALRSTDPPAWIPLTRLSHMLDFQL